MTNPPPESTTAADRHPTDASTSDAPHDAATPRPGVPQDTRAIAAWLEMLATQKRYSPHTVAGYRRDLQSLQRCFPEQTLDALQEAHIRKALAQLHAQGRQPRSLARALAAWRSYYEWRAPQAGLARNPAHGVRGPRLPHHLPKALSVDQAQALLDRTRLPPASTPVELRDMAMFEVLYSSGLRLAELVGLDWRPVNQAAHRTHSWIDLEESQVTVLGKGGKTRQVPLGRQAVVALKAWLEKRAALLGTHPDPDSDAALFLGVRGRRIHPRVVQLQLQALAVRAGLPVNVHPHSLRHSFASHLLQSSHDLRAVQELLGHANIATTQIYTRLDFQHLAASYDEAHPRAHRKTKS